MPLEQAEKEDIIASLTESLKGVLAEQVNSLTNKYDKALDKKVAKLTEPVLRDAAKAARANKGGNGKLGGKKLARTLLERGVSLEKVKEMGLKPGKKFEAKLGKPSGDGKPGGKTEVKEFKDPAGKKQYKRLMDEIETIKAEREDAKKQAEDARIDSEVNAMLSGFEWAKPSSSKVAFNLLRPKVQRDPDTGKLHIDDSEAESYIKATIPDEYDYLLAPVNKGGSGAVKGTGKRKGVDLDELGSMSKEDQAAAGRQIAQLLGA